MTDQTTYSRRRSVLKAVGGLASLQLVGQAAADVGGTTRFAEIGVVHEFRSLPEEPVTALSHTPQLHQVGPEEEVRFHPELSIEQLRTESQDGWVVWSGDYYSLPSVVVKDEPRSLIVSELNEHLQPKEAVKVVNQYRSPKIRVSSANEGVTIKSQGLETTVGPREKGKFDLNSRKVVVDTVDEAGKQPLEVHPAIVVKNYGTIAE